MTKPVGTRRDSPDFDGLAAAVFEELKGDERFYSPAQFVEVVATKLAIVGSAATGSDTARQVIACGDGIHWIWHRNCDQWRVRRT